MRMNLAATPDRPALAMRPRSDVCALCGGRGVLALAAVALLFVLSASSAVFAKVDVFVTEIKVEGNSTIATEKILAKIRTRPEKVLDDRVVDDDIKTLSKQNWFASVEYRLVQDPKRRGSILVFQVVELPLLKSVEFRGWTRKGPKMKDIESTTGLKKGERYDTQMKRSAPDRIEQLYRDKGFQLAQARLLKGGAPGENEVVILIFEGPKFQIDHVDFQGNSFVSDSVLLEKVVNKRKLFGLLPGTWQTDLLDEDVRKLREYYENNGFLISKVSWMVRPTQGGGLGSLTLTFVVEEGMQYHINSVVIEGNKQIKKEQLEKILRLKPGMAYNETVKEVDLKSIEIEYHELGCIETQIEAVKKAADNRKGLVDLVWRIQEGAPFDLGEIIIHGNEKVEDRVVRREANQAGLVPGEPLNKNRIELYRKRLTNLGYFQNNPEMGKPIDIQIVHQRPATVPYAEQLGTIGTMGSGGMSGSQFARGQDPGDAPAPENRSRAPQAPAIEPADDGVGSAFPFGGVGDRFEPPPNQLPEPFPPQGPVGAPPVIDPGIGPGARNASPFPPASRTPPLNQDGVPPNIFPSLPGSNFAPIMPDEQDPFKNRSIADVLVNLDEISTGRFMFSVGASSYQGLFASIMFMEQDFNLFRLPQTTDDLFNGRAFRGAGQQLSVNVTAGTLLNYATISLTDPYIFDLPISGSISGSAFTRFYPDWLEKRIGPKIAIGRQIGTSLYADVAVTAEEIDFYGYRTPAPAAYLASAGNTFLSSIRPTLRYDNRNNPFNPSSGEYVELSFMQAWGSFTFPQATIEGRKYFTTGSRPDGSGKRTLLLRGVYGVSGRDTPVYERFFAGDFRSFRGFWFRGVGPHVFGANVGGFTEALGTIEYMFPLTANDRISQVVFCDFGTINQSYDLNNFRASIGTGLRIQIPGFTVLPLALDIAFPIAKQPGDITRFFSFNIGASF